MPYLTITEPRELHAFCRRLASVEQIALDTEFVSERTYRSVLCLVQVAAGDELALLDPVALPDLTPFWEVLADPAHEAVVHAGRGEMEFCFRALGRLPQRLFDMQIAAGLIGHEYPAGYANLIARVLGETPNKDETRTDWRRRPLSERQIQYALDDIRYLPALRGRIHQRLAELDRLDWMQEEMDVFRNDLLAAFTQERWRRVPGTAGLGSRSLAILRELWRWREAEAERRDCPPRRVLRDDLLVELAKRQTADVKRIRAVRGMERQDLGRQLPRIAEAIERGRGGPGEPIVPSTRSEWASQFAVLGQFLFAALGTICRRAELSPGLVGTPNDIRDLIAYRVGPTAGNAPPALAGGWRAEIVGSVFDDLLAGRLSVRITDPASDAPLAFERVTPQ